MRNLPRRSFTVEVKSGGRRQTTFIPTRIAVPEDPSRGTQPRAALPAPEPRVETRRILPNLIVPEAPRTEPDPAPAFEERPRRPRGRPRKERPAPEQAVAVLPEPPQPSPMVAPSRVGPPRQKRRDGVPPAADLPRGERWKRRLGRWCR